MNRLLIMSCLSSVANLLAFFLMVGLLSSFGVALPLDRWTFAIFMLLQPFYFNYIAPLFKNMILLSISGGMILVMLSYLLGTAVRQIGLYLARFF